MDGEILPDMKILDRYLIRRCASPFVYCLAVFALLFVIGDLFENLDTFLGIPRWGAVAIKYYILLVPSVLTFIAAFAVLLALLYSLGRLQRHNEISAMQAAGISLGRVAAPLLGASLILSLAVFGVNEIIVPQATREIETLKTRQLKGEYRLRKQIKDVAFLHPPTNRSYYFETFDLQENKLLGVNIYETDDSGRLKKKITAREGRWTGQDWHLADVHVQEFINSDLPVTTRSTEMNIDLDLAPQDLKTGHQEMSALNFRELVRILEKRKKFPTATLRPLQVELHQRFALPLSCVIMGLIGVAFGLKLVRGGMLAGVGISLALGFLYYVFYSIATALGKHGVVTPWLAVWSINLIFGGAGAYLLAKRN